MPVWHGKSRQWQEENSGTSRVWGKGAVLAVADDLVIQLIN
jgi:hypothetical protein